MENIVEVPSLQEESRFSSITFSFPSWIIRISEIKGDYVTIISITLCPAAPHPCIIAYAGEAKKIYP